MQLIKNGEDHAGHPLVTATPEEGTPYDLDVTMLMCLLGIHKGVPVYRAGACSRLKARGLVEGSGSEWTLTAAGMNVLVFGAPILSEFVGDV